MGEENGVGYSPSGIISTRVEISSIENEPNSMLSVLRKEMTPLKRFSKSWSSWLEAQKSVWHRSFSTQLMGTYPLPTPFWVWSSQVLKAVDHFDFDRILYNSRSCLRCTDINWGGERETSSFSLKPLIMILQKLVLILSHCRIKKASWPTVWLSITAASEDLT